MTLIPLDLIDENGHNVRRTAASAEQDAELQASIGALGILQPVLLRADPEQPGRYLIVAGHRRVRCARAAAFAEIPAEVLPPADQATYAAIQTAENMVRVPMDPVDQWRSIVTLQDAGYTLKQAAGALGLSERRVRQLDKMGHIAPEILDLLIGQPRLDMEQIAKIAAAPLGRQREALERSDAADDFEWRLEEIADACVSKRLSRSLAIFDVSTAGVLFEEDLFAQPGSDEQFMTTDVTGFLVAQKAALEERVAARSKKERVQIGKPDRWGQLALPKGFERVYGTPPKTFPRKGHRVLFTTVSEDGYSLGQIIELVAADTTALKKADAKSIDTESDRAEEGGSGVDESDGNIAEKVDEGGPSAEEELGTALTKRGQSLIATIKTAGLCRRLTAVDESPLPLSTLCAALIVAIAADNVSVNNRTTNLHGRAQFGDLLSAVIAPGGTFIDLTEEALGQLAADVLTRMLRVTDPTTNIGSGLPAEWIGAAIGADSSLPRFDTSELLACMSKAALTELAAEHGRTGLKTVAGLREALEGSLPDWRPVTFGAPGPARAAGPADDQDGEEAEAA